MEGREGLTDEKCKVELRKDGGGHDSWVPWLGGCVVGVWWLVGVAVGMGVATDTVRDSVSDTVCFVAILEGFSSEGGSDSC